MVDPLKSTQIPALRTAPAVRSEAPAAPLASPAPAPTESFTLTARPAPTPPPAEAPPEPPPGDVPAPPREAAPRETSWSIAGTTVSLTGHGTLVQLEEPGHVAFAESVKRPFSLAGQTDADIREAMRGREGLYLKKFPYKDGPQADALRAELKHRYADSRVHPDRVHELTEQFAADRGIDLRAVPKELDSMACDQNAVGLIKQATDRLVDKFFASDQASNNPEKAELVKAESRRFLDLLIEARKEGDPHLASEQLSATEAYKLVAGNIGALAVQDRAAAENTLGDHGVRHLVGHNIRVCETLADQLQAQGVRVTAKDRLIMHQTMILHDLGYSTQNVRGAINNEGAKGQDAGHPLLGARYIRERFESPADPIRKVFSATDMQLMHRCVMYHDMDASGGPGVEFRMTPMPSFEDRGVNLESMTRLADNTHAFDDKLPEVLYRTPATLKHMRMIKTAGDIGDKTLLDGLKADLKDRLEHTAGLSDDDKHALGMAVKNMSGGEFNFSVRRILGNRPEYAIDPDGKVTVSLQESAVHRDVMKLCGQPALGLLDKYIKDISGAKVHVEDSQTRVDTPAVNFELGVGKNRAQEMTPFQTQLSAAFLEDPAFAKWAVKDATDGAAQSAIEKLITTSHKLDEATLRKAAAKYMEVDGADQQGILDGLTNRSRSLTTQRKAALEEYLGQA